MSLLVFSQIAPITDKREVADYTFLGKEYTDMLTLPPGHFPREHQVCGSLFFLPRRLVTKQFVCHHVRLKWKSDLLAISCGAVEPIVGPFCGNLLKVSDVWRHVHDTAFHVTLLHA